MDPTLQYYLDTIIPYRLYAVRSFRIAMSFVEAYPKGGEYVVKVGDKVKLKGRSTAITNPMIEIGLVHSRVLLEFLGLKAKSATELGDSFTPQSTDIHIGKYGLSSVTKEDAVKLCTSDKKRAEQALAETITAANKLVAHSTEKIDTDPHAIDSYLIASDAIPVLYNLYFYQKLGLKMPDIEPKKYPAAPNNWLHRTANKVRSLVSSLCSTAREP